MNGRRAQDEFYTVRSIEGIKITFSLEDYCRHQYNLRNDGSYCKNVMSVERTKTVFSGTPYPLSPEVNH